MTESDILSQLGTILQQPGPIAANAVLEDIPEWDSLAQITVVAFFKNTLKKAIPFTTVQAAKTPADLLLYWKN